MIVLELDQGHYRNLDGVSRESAIAMFQADDAVFLERHPKCREYHRPCWREYEVSDTATAPWGHEWYTVDAAGKLQLHSAYYDSSG